MTASHPAMRGTGWLQEPRNDKDYPFSARRKAAASRPAEVRFDDLIAAVRDQGPSSSCVGQSVAAAMELRAALDGRRIERLSALAAYWNARALADLQNEDGGAYIRDGLHCAHLLGLGTEATWPFDVQRINDRPGMGNETSGIKFAGGEYRRITERGQDRVEAVLDALQARCPVVFGTLVDDRFMSWDGSATIPAPEPGTLFRGGHAMVCCGFKDHGKAIRWLSSWGRGWADNGLAWVDAQWMAAEGTEDVWAVMPRLEAA